MQKLSMLVHSSQLANQSNMGEVEQGGATSVLESWQEAREFSCPPR